MTRPSPITTLLTWTHAALAGLGLLTVLSTAGWWILVAVVGDRATSGGRDRALQAAAAWGDATPVDLGLGIAGGVAMLVLCTGATWGLRRGKAAGPLLGGVNALGMLVVGVYGVVMGADPAWALVGTVLPGAVLAAIALNRR